MYNGLGYLSYKVTHLFRISKRLKLFFAVLLQFFALL